MQPPYLEVISEVLVSNILIGIFFTDDYGGIQNWIKK